VIVPARAFVLGGIAAASCGARVIKVLEKSDYVPDVDALLEAVTPRTRVLYLPNVNNPTGALLPFAEIERLRAGLREDILLILDSAYRDYVEASDYASGDGLAGGSSGNVAVTGTFSKSYALGGLRLGWVHAARDIVATLNLVRPAFGVGLVTQAAGIAALADRAHFDAELATVKAERHWLVDALTKRGLVVRNAHANFVLAEFRERGPDAAAANAFLTARGVLVRPAANYGFSHALRITIGKREDLLKVLSGLDAWLEQTRS
jgi:histidinol-phosphate aminotransferase